MSDRKIKTTEDTQNSFSGYKSYSIAEIMAAGGATAFASKLGKDPKKIMQQLKGLPSESFFTEDEFQRAINILNESK